MMCKELLKEKGDDMQYKQTTEDIAQTIEIPIKQISITGDIYIPKSAQAIIIFAHGSGSSRFSPRNQYVAKQLNQAGFATLLLDLLTPTEDQEDEFSRKWRFDIALLAERLAAATDWVLQQPLLQNLKIAYFGASTGAAAALIAAALKSENIYAVVSRGGRPDLAGEYLPKVTAPTLLIVGGYDDVVIELNQEAQAKLHTESKITIVPGATHLFEEPNTLEQVANHAINWFKKYL